MFSRVIIVTVLLSATFLIHVKETSSYLEPYLICLYFIIISTYLLTLLYALLVNRLHNLIPLTYFQILVDLFFATAIVYITGGIESIFSFLYILSIINASILLYRRGGLLTASASSIFYGASLDLEYYGIIPPLMGNIPSVIYYNASEVLYNIAMNITAFFATALLSNLLAEQVRSSREQLTKKETQLRHFEALYENIIQSIGSGILTLAGDRTITSFNRAAQEITGLSATDTVGRKFDQLFSLPKQDQSSQASLAPSVSLPQRLETLFVRGDGSEVYLGLSTSALRDKAGNETGSIVTFQDLTKYRHLQEQIKRMDRLAAVGSFAAGIAHEIRNPLTSLSGSLQVLREELDLTSENLHLMNIALTETTRLNNLITDFLLFAQPERGEKSPTNLTAVIEETLELFTLSPECRDTIPIPSSIPPELFVQGNAEQLKQVFWNILKNAVQAQAQEGHILVEGRIVEPQASPGQKDQVKVVEITISDGGCGIPQHIRAKIFDPFFTTKDFGSGLGLAISDRIIASHRGNITIQSQEGQGTRVTVSLPLLIPAHKD